jgi:hypothetical protein
VWQTSMIAYRMIRRRSTLWRQRRNEVSARNRDPRSGVSRDALALTPRDQSKSIAAHAAPTDFALGDHFLAAIAIFQVGDAQDLAGVDFVGVAEHGFVGFEDDRVFAGFAVHCLGDG